MVTDCGCVCAWSGQVCQYDYSPTSEVLFCLCKNGDIMCVPPSPRHHVVGECVPPSHLVACHLDETWLFRLPVSLIDLIETGLPYFAY